MDKVTHKSEEIFNEFLIQTHQKLESLSNIESENLDFVLKICINNLENHLYEYDIIFNSDNLRNELNSYIIKKINYDMHKTNYDIMQILRNTNSDINSLDNNKLFAYFDEAKVKNINKITDEIKFIMNNFFKNEIEKKNAINNNYVYIVNEINRMAEKMDNELKSEHKKYISKISSYTIDSAYYTSKKIQSNIKKETKTQNLKTIAALAGFKFNKSTLNPTIIDLTNNNEIPATIKQKDNIKYIEFNDQSNRRFMYNSLNGGNQILFNNSNNTSLFTNDINNELLIENAENKYAFELKFGDKLTTIYHNLDNNTKIEINSKEALEAIKTLYPNIQEYCMQRYPELSNSIKENLASRFK